MVGVTVLVGVIEGVGLGIGSGTQRAHSPKLDKPIGPWTKVMLSFPMTWLLMPTYEIHFETPFTLALKIINCVVSPLLGFTIGFVV